MTRPSARLCLLSVVVIALAALPSGAAAGVEGGQDSAAESCPVAKIELNVTYYCQLEFSLAASNGYRITVAAEPGRPGVEITVAGRAGDVNYVTYKGRTTADSIDAPLGRLGNVSMRFRSAHRTRTRHLSKKCQSQRPSTISSQVGEFVGTFRFRGEHGYTRVTAHHVSGGLGDPLTNIAMESIPCDFRESAAEQKRERESISLNVNAPHPKVIFTAAKAFGDLRSGFGATRSRPYLFFALAGERSDGVSILRTAAAIGGSSAFSFDQGLTQAMVAPPAPFSGSGYFRRDSSGAPEWSGDLAVELPGLGRVGLIPGQAELATVADQLKQLEEGLESRLDLSG